MSRCVVLDTNVLISAALWPQSAPARALAQVLRQGALVACTDSLAELQSVLMRPKFDCVAPRPNRSAFVELVGRRAVQVDVSPRHRAQAHGACRGPDDELFLALALAAQARCLVSGDADLLALHPWQGITICTAASYVAREFYES